MKVKRLIKTNCDQWRSGMCAAVGEPLYCPGVRAQCLPGECCHHPAFIPAHLGPGLEVTRDGWREVLHVAHVPHTTRFRRVLKRLALILRVRRIVGVE